LIAAAPDAVPAIRRNVESAGIPISVVGRLTGDPAAFTLYSGSIQRELPIFAVDEVARVLAEHAPAAPPA
jgi:hypothetical protein